MLPILWLCQILRIPLKLTAATGIICVVGDEEQIAHTRHLFHAGHRKIGRIAAHLDLHPDADSRVALTLIFVYAPFRHPQPNLRRVVV